MSAELLARADKLLEKLLDHDLPYSAQSGAAQIVDDLMAALRAATPAQPTERAGELTDDDLQDIAARDECYDENPEWGKLFNNAKYARAVLAAQRARDAQQGVVLASSDPVGHRQAMTDHEAEQARLTANSGEPDEWGGP
jgi:hypothetical protein